MDLYSEKCIALLKMIARANHELGALEQKLRGLQSVTGVRGGIDVRDYARGVSVERYIEADLATGANICWWLELSTTHDRTWLLEATVYFSHGDMIHVFPERSIEHVDDVSDALQILSAELIGSVEAVPRIVEILICGNGSAASE